MITAKFIGLNSKIAFKVSGHAGFANSGEDIVCAAVTSAVQLTINAITDILKVDALVCVNEDEISLSLPQNPSKEQCDFIEALYLHLLLLSEDYERNIKVIVTEV